MKYFTMSLFALVLLVQFSCTNMDYAPLSLHPENPHYFMFRGKPTVLITSGEHYGAVLNLDFDYITYLDELHAHGLNHTRLFSGVYHEVPGSFKITDNTLAPEPGRYICPWKKGEYPGSADGGNKFDLTAWDDAYFKRLRDFLYRAGERGIVVEVNLFCPFYTERLWSVNLMNSANNVNGVGNCGRDEVYTLEHEGLTSCQEAVTRKIVEELRDFDNIYYEVCNEPYAGKVTRPWEDHIVKIITETESAFRHRHLISKNISNGRARITNPNPDVSIFNFHYCYPPDVVAMNYDLNRVIGENETGFRGSDDVLYRTEGWDFIIAGGALYNNLDYSFSVKHPDGSFSGYESPGGGSPALRRQLGILKTFIDGFDFIRMAPDSTVIRGGVPDGVTVRVLCEPGRQYAVYVMGGTIVELEMEIPKGEYTVEWVDTVSGSVVQRGELEHNGGAAILASPEYTEDIALRIKLRII